MSIISIKVYCHSEETAFQDDIPGIPIEPGKAYEVNEDELVPEFNLGKTVINTIDINPDNWFSSQEILVNDVPALLVDFDGREFYVPYTKEEFRELLQNSSKSNCENSIENNGYLNEFYIGVGITQVLHQLEKEYGKDAAVTKLVREMYDAQSKCIRNMQ